MYAKLENGVLRPAPSLLAQDGMTVANPTEDQLQTAGYMPVRVSDRPKQDGMCAVPHYEMQGGQIVQFWTLEPLPSTPEERLEALEAALKKGLSL